MPDAPTPGQVYWFAQPVETEGIQARGDKPITKGGLVFSGGKLFAAGDGRGGHEFTGSAMNAPGVYRFIVPVGVTLLTAPPR